MNRREDWLRDWREFGPDGALLILDETSPTFPRDGRETIDDEYEEYASTATVGDYIDASQRVRHPPENGPALPDDFGDYLNQRIPSIPLIGWVDEESEIDRFGQITPYTLTRQNLEPDEIEVVEHMGLVKPHITDAKGS